MTHKEKAVQLVGSFYWLMAYDSMSTVGRQIAYEQAKRQAKICLNELIENDTPICSDYSMGVGYWQLVKNEVDKLLIN